jgi:lysylphosphatidylglycerol synthetase-like protein (DUF2156 family)
MKEQDFYADFIRRAGRSWRMGQIGSERQTPKNISGIGKRTKQLGQAAVVMLSATVKFKGSMILQAQVMVTFAGCAGNG